MYSPRGRSARRWLTFLADTSTREPRENKKHCTIGFIAPNSHLSAQCGRNNWPKCDDIGTSYVLRGREFGPGSQKAVFKKRRLRSLYFDLFLSLANKNRSRKMGLFLSIPPHVHNICLIRILPLLNLRHKIQFQMLKTFLPQILKLEMNLLPILTPLGQRKARTQQRTIYIKSSQSLTLNQSQPVANTISSHLRETIFQKIVRSIHLAKSRSLTGLQILDLDLKVLQSLVSAHL